MFLDTSFALARDRGARRDANLFGSVAVAQRAYSERYHAACRLYLDEVDPAAHSGIVIGNDDIEHPQLRRLGAN
jgi:uridine kinase